MQVDRSTCNYLSFFIFTTSQNPKENDSKSCILTGVRVRFSPEISSNTARRKPGFFLCNGGSGENRTRICGAAGLRRARYSDDKGKTLSVFVGCGYLSTGRKQGWNLLSALEQVFIGQPILPVAALAEFQTEAVSLVSGIRPQTVHAITYLQTAPQSQLNFSKFLNSC